MERPTSGPIDLDALADFLDSDHLADAMSLSELDGYLTGIAVGPELIEPQHWLFKIWGEDPAAFQSTEQMVAILRVIMGRYNQIIECLDTDPDTLKQIFAEDAEGIARYGEWAVGFTEAMQLRMDAWQPMLDDEDATILMVPIAAITAAWGAELNEDPELTLPEEALNELLEEADVALPLCAASIRAFWQSRMAKPTKPAMKAKPTTKQRKKPERDRRQRRR